MSIKAFTHKGLDELFCDGETRKIGREFHDKLAMILDALDGATCVADLRAASGFHRLKGKRKKDYAMKVSGNMRVTFQFERGDKGDILNVDFEDYH
jgi:proteic killer suppression protein